MEPELLRSAQLRQAMYLGFVIIQTGCSGAVSRFDTRFRALLNYFRDEKQIIRPEIRELHAKYPELYLTLWQSGPSKKFIPLIVDAMFHEFFKLHQHDNPIDAYQVFCEEELANFVRKYFPELDQQSMAYERLVQICRDLKDEAAEIGASRTYSTPSLKKIRRDAPRLESRSPVFKEVIRIAAKAARSRAPILITGETGTGKNVLARFIHQQSPRNKGPFITINCTALPDNLLESELFGYRKGAFTEARTNKEGQLIQADGGTVFLDEIGEMSPRIQVKLLRFLQDHSILPLGAVKPIFLDVRVLAATNQNLEEAMNAGRFRQDLFYRLNVFHLKVPPLRQRTGDIPTLAAHFIEKYNQQNQTTVEGLNPSALNWLMKNEWPGNIRELENIIHRAVILAETGFIEKEHLVGFSLAESVKKVKPPVQSNKKKINEKSLLKALERALLLPQEPGRHCRRLAPSVPLAHIICFFRRTGGCPFAPRTFSDHISPPDWLHRRDKLSSRILKALYKAGILRHNNRRAQAARYFLNPDYLL